MAIKKLGAKTLNGGNETKKRIAIFDEPTIEDIASEEAYEEDVEFDEVTDEEVEEVYDEVEAEDSYKEEIEEEPVKKVTKSVTAKGSTPKAVTKSTPKVESKAKSQSTPKSSGKKQMMKKKGEPKPVKQQSSESNVYKRDSLLKDVIKDLDELGYEMTLEGMSTIMSSIEKNILAALEEGYRITLLGNQIKPQERNARISKAPNSEYATLTDKYTAFVWSRTPNDKTIIKGTKNEDGTFTDLEGNVYYIDENGDVVQQ